MSFKSLFVSIPLFWRCATALPAGPGSWQNGSSFVHPSEDGFAASAAYNLIDTYDASNWVSKFDVQDIADPTRMLVRSRFIAPHTNMCNRWIC